MANEKNLKRLSSREARENGKKGGQKSVESRRQKKLLKECMTDLLDLDIKDKKLIKHFKDLGIEENISNKMLITLGLFNEAASGNVQAFKEIRNLIGEQVEETTQEEEKQAQLLEAIERAVTGGN